MENLNPKEAVSAPEAPAGAPSAEERQWAMFAHLSALLGGLLTSGWGGNIGFFVGPLVIWMMKKDTMPFVNDQAKEALSTLGPRAGRLAQIADFIVRRER